ncbi:MAG: diphthine--ammonia ligase [archaeon]
MKLGILFSGGKDSTYATLVARKEGHSIECLISLWSKNQDSFMFHTPAIELTKKQAECMGIPLIIQETRGEKEIELKDLEKAIKLAIKKYKIEGIVTGAVESVYQASRVQNICNKLNIECFNPLWQKNQIEILEDLVKNNFEVVISGVAAYPLDKTWVGRRIDKKFIEEISVLSKKYKINPAGEGGEFESLVLDGYLFNHRMGAELKNVFGEGNSWRGEFVVGSLIERAKAFAERKHAGQFRADGKTPYIVHPLRVADIVKKFKKSHKIDELVAAAYLHDTLEDTKTGINELRNNFGETVALLVVELTSNPLEIENSGKAKYLSEKLSSDDNMSSWALTIKLADRLDNVSDLKNSLKGKEWALNYKMETIEILDFLEKNRYLSDTHKALIKEIRQKLKEVK